MNDLIYQEAIIHMAVNDVSGFQNFIKEGKHPC